MYRRIITFLCKAHGPLPCLRFLTKLNAPILSDEIFKLYILK